MSLPAPENHYELPGARAVVGRGFDLVLASEAQLRRVSLYFGGLVVAFLGPLVVLGIVVAMTAPQQVAEILEAGRALSGAPVRDAAWLEAVGLLVVAVSLGAGGAGFVLVEGGLVGMALLAGRWLGRPLTLRHGLVRSRQVFWRSVRASFLVGLVVFVVQAVTSELISLPGLDGEAETVGTLVVSTALAAPLTYAQAGIVLGDGGAREALRRSVRLYRARPGVGLVVAFFPAVFSGMIQLWALSAGSEVLLLLAQVTNLGFGTDALHSAATVVVLLAALAAVGSLFFTLGALFAAPQVVAFLGLTHYAGGLDRAIAPRAPESASGVAPAVAPDAGTAPALARPAGPPMLALPGRPAPPALRLGSPTPAPTPPPATAAPASAWAQTPRDPGDSFRWVTLPMLALITTEALLVAAGIVQLAGRLAS